MNITSSHQRNLAWKLNWYRQSELEGALLLGRLVGTVEDAFLCTQLTRHAAEEAEHSRLWDQAIRGCGLPHIRIFRSYQSFYIGHHGLPATLLEVLCFTHIFERRVHQRFSLELEDPSMPQPARLAFEKMIEDEKGHLGWVARWLRRQPGSAALLRQYQVTDLQVFHELEPYEHRLYELPGLGREHASGSHARELHPSHP